MPRFEEIAFCDLNSFPNRRYPQRLPTFRRMICASKQLPRPAPKRPRQEKKLLEERILSARRRAGGCRTYCSALSPRSNGGSEHGNGAALGFPGGIFRPPWDHPGPENHPKVNRRKLDLCGGSLFRVSGLQNGLPGADFVAQRGDDEGKNGSTEDAPGSEGSSGTAKRSASR